jgi:glycosyltransferase involved in cell wall biosynthesis
MTVSRKTSKLIQAIREHPFFDEQWYLETYPDVAISKIDAAEHYFRVGWLLERNPGPSFKTRDYLEMHPDLRQDNICPLTHVHMKITPPRTEDDHAPSLPNPSPNQIKEIETVRASRMFDREWYADNYPEVSQIYIDEATHYVLLGANELLNPGPNFSTRYYFQKHQDIRQVGMNPLAHYENWGRGEGRAILPAYLDCARTDPAISASQCASDASYWCDDNAAREYLSRLLTVAVSGEPVRMYQSFDCDQARRFVSALQFLSRTEPKDMELVSIIMPTYNRASQIGKAISSVLEQSWSNFELIVIDDGSTDETSNVLNAYSDPRIRVLHSNRSGVSGARNEGLAHALGEVIFYLDSDNEWTPDFLWLMMHSMKHSNARCGYAGTRLQSPREFLIGYRGEPFNWEACLELNYVDMNVFCHHRDLMVKHGNFDTKLKRMVDWDLILRYTRSESAFYAPFIGCIYYEDSLDMERITTSQPILSRKLVHDRNALNCSLSDATENLKLNFAIKMFAPYSDREAWGDYHYAESLAEALQRQGHTVRIDFRGQWYDQPVHADDVVIVLRGLEAYQPRGTQLNIFWGISHPDTVTPEEYDRYQGIFVASASYAELLQILLNRPVHTLWQCTDTTRFAPPAPNNEPLGSSPEHGIFIGNSRKEYRQIVRWAVEAGLPLDVIGQDWENYISSDNILAKNAPNTSLASYYGTAAFVLNDHWHSMRDFGFVSNRVFDVLAAGGQLISDRLPSVERLFGEAVISVSGAAELQKIVDKGAMKRSPDQRRTLAKTVHEQHSFDRRAATLIEWVKAHVAPKAISDSISATAGDEEALPKRTRVGVLAPWSDPQRMGSTIERIVAPLTIDRVAAEIQIIQIETAEDCRAADVSALVISAPDFAPDQALIAAVRGRSDQGLPVYIDCKSGPLATGWGQLAEEYTEIWCHDDTTCALWPNGSARTVKARIDPRIWRRYRRPRVIETTAGAVRLLVIYEGGQDEASIAKLNALVRLLDRLEQTDFNQISLEIVGAEAAQLDERPWLQCTPWPDNCTNYFRKARWLLDNSFADIGIITEADSDQRLLQFMALGMAPIALPSTACGIMRDPSIEKLVEVSENDNRFLLNLLTLWEEPESLLDRRKAAFDCVWQSFSTLNDDDQNLSDILTGIVSPK